MPDPVVQHKRAICNRAYETAYKDAVTHTLQRARSIAKRGSDLNADPIVIGRALASWTASTRTAEGIKRSTMRARSAETRTQDRVRSSIDHAIAMADRISRDAEELRRLAQAHEDAPSAKERKRIRSIARTVARRIEISLETLPTIDPATLPGTTSMSAGRMDGIDRALWVLETLGDQALPMLAEQARRDAIRWARALRKLRMERAIRRSFHPKDPITGRPINACRVPGPIVLDDSPEAVRADALAYD